ncbi:hypothetical protein ACOSQ3_016476 [Xanthoceras sorbifolium]
MSSMLRAFSVGFNWFCGVDLKAHLAVTGVFHVAYKADFLLIIIWIVTRLNYYRIYGFHRNITHQDFACHKGTIHNPADDDVKKTLVNKRKPKPTKLRPSLCCRLSRSIFSISICLSYSFYLFSVS